MCGSGLAAIALLVHQSLRESDPAREASNRTSFFGRLKRGKFIVVALLALMFGFGLAATGGFVAPLAEQRGLGFISIYFFCYSGGAIAVRFIGGRLADHFGENRILPYSIIFYSFGIFLLPFTYSQLLLCVAGMLSGLGHGLLFPILNTMAIRDEASAVRGKATGIFTGGIDTGIFAGSFILGYIGDWFGLEILFLCAGLSMASTLFFSVSARTAPRHSKEGIMKNIKSFYQGAEYRTPQHRTGLLSRLFPTLMFYLKVIAIVCRASWAAKRGHYDSRDWYDSSAATVRALEETGCRMEITGLEHLQGIDRPCIFIGNHMSTLETFVLPSLIMPHGFDLTYVIKRSLVDYPIFGDVVKTRDPVVVDRVNPRDDLKVVMEEGARRLEQGRSLIIFPQHTRTVEFDAKQFNSIGIKLAQRTGAIVVPVALLTWAWSSGKMLKDFGPLFPSRTIHFAFGEPMEVPGKGQEEQQRIVDFIQGNLKRWRSGAEN